MFLIFLATCVSAYPARVGCDGFSVTFTTQNIFTFGRVMGQAVTDDLVITAPSNAVVGETINVEVTNVGRGLIHAIGGTFSDPSNAGYLIDPRDGTACAANVNVMKQWDNAPLGNLTIGWTPQNAGTFDIWSFSADGGQPSGDRKRNKVTVVVTNPSPDGGSSSPGGGSSSPGGGSSSPGGGSSSPGGGSSSPGGGSGSSAGDSLSTGPLSTGMYCNPSLWVSMIVLVSFMFC